MPSPFPGFDPYIESQINWLDFHGDMIVELKRSLLNALPPGFVAESDVYVSILLPESRQSGNPRTAAREGDVTVFTTRPSDGGKAGTAILERPTVLPGVVTQPETVNMTRIRQRYLKVIDRRGEKPKVVAIVELLSLTNKEGAGFTAYEKKQAQLLDSDVHYLEIDLLRAGEYATFVPKEIVSARGAWDYLVTLRDISEPEVFAFWRVGLRDGLPTIELPLTHDVAPVQFDLQASFNRSFEACFYERRIDYTQESEPPLAPEDALWADDLLRAAGLRP